MYFRCVVNRSQCFPRLVCLVLAFVLFLTLICKCIFFVMQGRRNLGLLIYDGMNYSMISSNLVMIACQLSSTVLSCVILETLMCECFHFFLHVGLNFHGLCDLLFWIVFATVNLTCAIVSWSLMPGKSFTDSIRMGLLINNKSSVFPLRIGKYISFSRKFSCVILSNMLQYVSQFLYFL